jgi:hypothetical protein
LTIRNIQTRRKEQQEHARPTTILYRRRRRHENDGSKKDNVVNLLHPTHPPLADPKFHHKFRRRFRMPHDEFIKLVARIVDNKMFKGGNLGDGMLLEN